jgi:hypothetical protein
MMKNRKFGRRLDRTHMTVPGCQQDLKLLEQQIPQMEQEKAALGAAGLPIGVLGRQIARKKQWRTMKSDWLAEQQAR